MKYDNYTIKAREALASAQQHAMAKGNTVLSTLHLLHALLDEDKRVAIAILQKIGTDTKRLRDMVDSELGRLPTGKTDQILPDQAFSQVVLDAHNQGDKLGDAYVSADHLLLSLAQVKSDAQEVLNVNSITAKIIEAAIQEIRSGEKTPVTIPRRPTRPWNALALIWWLWPVRENSIR